jgi:hypothetical protein
MFIQIILIDLNGISFECFRLLINKKWSWFVGHCSYGIILSSDVDCSMRNTDDELGSG